MIGLVCSAIIVTVSGTQDLRSSVRMVCTVVVVGSCATGMGGEGPVVNLVFIAECAGSVLVGFTSLVLRPLQAINLAHHITSDGHGCYFLSASQTLGTSQATVTEEAVTS